MYSKDYWTFIKFTHAYYKFAICWFKGNIYKYSTHIFRVGWESTIQYIYSGWMLILLASSSCNNKFGQLILRKIIKIIATTCQILRLKCTKFDIGWAPPQTPLEVITALPRPLAGFKGAASRQGVERGRDVEREGRGVVSQVKSSQVAFN